MLLRHPGLVEAAVIGRPHPDWGEEVVAFVVATPGAAVAEAALDRLCLDHIARFKRPREYRFVDSLPKNNYGKEDRTAPAPDRQGLTRSTFLSSRRRPGSTADMDPGFRRDGEE